MEDIQRDVIACDEKKYTGPRVVALIHGGSWLGWARHESGRGVVEVATPAPFKRAFELAQHRSRRGTMR